MKRTLTALVLGFSLLLASGGIACANDYDKGMEALGRGDYAAALREFRPLAEQGIVIGQIILGSMYNTGKGVPQEYQEAAKWYRKAAEQGNALGQGILGTMYQEGKGVLQDNVYAHMWFNLAASDGLDDARIQRDNLAKRMTPAQIAEAQRLARECVQKQYKGC